MNLRHSLVIAGKLALIAACDLDASGDQVSVVVDCDETKAGDQPPTAAYPDRDGDTFGEAGAPASFFCVVPTGFVTNDDDCNDADAKINPPAKDVCNFTDDDCDGFVDEDEPHKSVYPDLDGDGFGERNAPATKVCVGSPKYVADNTDCDDGDDKVHPSAKDVCNFKDDDCDGFVDEDVGPLTFYPDTDGDGFGNQRGPSILACVKPPGFVENRDDCDDADKAVNPPAKDICNFKDDDCDGFVDEDEPPQTAFRDTDGDGFGDARGPAMLMCVVGSSFSTNRDDCDDSDKAVNPPAKDICNFKDDDCDGFVDEDVPPGRYYRDADLDGYGDARGPAVKMCVQPSSGFVPNNEDCDDTNKDINPPAKDICNFRDDDCDNFVDEDVPSIKVFPDLDGDGFGDRNGPAIRVCVKGSGYSENNEDCDDTNKDINPPAKDVCNFTDDDCDGFVDEDEPAKTGYPDKDGDGYGDKLGPPIRVCVLGSGYVENKSDCDDSEANIHPQAKDICNFCDDDCDGLVDEDEPPKTAYPDGDGDGYGASKGMASKMCVVPSTHATNRDDCDDESAAVNPDAQEHCSNDVDDNCDELVDGADASCSVAGHCGEITTDTVWRATDEHVVTCLVTVKNSATLTIEDGTTVSFEAGGGLHIGGGEDDPGDLAGALVVNAPGAGVHFTSAADFPGAGDWDGLTLGVHDSGSTLNGLTIEYGGAGTPCLEVNDGDGTVTLERMVVASCANVAGIVVNGVDLRLDDVTSRDNLADGMHLLYATATSGFGTVRSTGNGGKAVVATIGVVPSLGSLGNDFTSNAQSVIEVLSDEIATDTIWPDPGVPYLLSGAMLVSGGASLTLTDGTTVQFGGLGEFAVGTVSAGSLLVSGVEGVLFTSDAAVPGPGDWLGLRFGEFDQGSSLTKVTVEYGGANGFGNLYFQGANDASVTDSIVRHSSSWGINRQDASPGLTDVSYDANALGDLL